MKRRGSKGQALIMVTLALFAMFGLVGLAVDLGWMFFVQKAAQRSADVAALAAAQSALDHIGVNAFTCGVNVVCQTPTACPPTVPSPPIDNIQAGCAYAAQPLAGSNLGFIPGGNSGKQNVTMEAATTSPPPTAPGVQTYYWVAARTAENVPQLFSTLLGNPTGTSSALATAAVLDSIVEGSLILLNRDNDYIEDAQGKEMTGTNLSGGGGPKINAPSIFLSSSCNGACADSAHAGELGGNATVNAGFTYIRDVGDVDLGSGAATWTAPPVNKADGSYFQDPMRGKGQPPAPTLAPGAGNSHPLTLDITGPSPDNKTGCLDPKTGVDTSLVLNPGYYYKVNTAGQGTGDQIMVSGCVHFANNNGGQAGFGDFIFFGGVQVIASHSVVTFDPGRYVFAGAKSGQPVFRTGNSVMLQDHTPLDASGFSQKNTDAGEIFIFTDTTYPGLQIPPEVVPIQGQLGFGKVDVQSGNNADSMINLHGLNDQDVYGALPTNLQQFSPVVFWQDQRNSNVQYDASGNILTDPACGGGGTINTPCTNPDPGAIDSRRMELWASQHLRLYGAVYQPRGAVVTVWAGSGYAGPIQLISGALDMQGGPELTLIGLQNPITRRIVALVR
jgi:hypothetical protein